MCLKNAFFVLFSGSPTTPLPTGLKCCETPVTPFCDDQSRVALTRDCVTVSNFQVPPKPDCCSTRALLSPLVTFQCLRRLRGAPGAAGFDPPLSGVHDRLPAIGLHWPPSPHLKSQTSALLHHDSEAIFVGISTPSCLCHFVPVNSHLYSWTVRDSYCSTMMSVGPRCSTCS